MTTTTKKTKKTAAPAPAAPTAPLDAVAAALTTMQETLAALATVITGSAAAPAATTTTTTAPPPSPMKTKEPEPPSLEGLKVCDARGCPAVLKTWTESDKRRGGVSICVQHTVLLLEETVGGSGTTTRYLPNVWLYSPQHPTQQPHPSENSRFRHATTPRPEFLTLEDGSNKPTAGIMLNAAQPEPVRLQSLSQTSRRVPVERLQAHALASALDEKQVVFARIHRGTFQRLNKAQWLEYFGRLVNRWFDIAKESATSTLETLEV